MSPHETHSHDASRTRGIRTETDSFGAIAVPANRYWGAQTRRSLQGFIAAGDLPKDIGEAILRATNEVIHVLTWRDSQRRFP